MSLKQPYLDVRGLSSEEAYKRISECIDKQFFYRDKKSFPPYRCKQILNAITHASLAESRKAELMVRLQQLRELRKNLPSDLRAIERKAQKERERVRKIRRVSEVNHKLKSKKKLNVFGKKSRSGGITVYAQPAKIIYTPM